MKKIENTQVTVLPLAQIKPDENQPRKFFDAAKLAELKISINTHGIMNPLIVEKKKDGTYLLIDGERRYRAALENKMKEVPAIILEETTPTERLIKQFHIQEQHEGWSGAEKAMAMRTLADTLGISMQELGKTLGVNPSTVKNYIAYAGLLERDSYQKSELSIENAKNIQAVKAYARKSLANAGQDFHMEDERALEKALINRMKNGELRQRKDFMRITDSIMRDPKTVARLIKTKVSGVELYKETDAEAMTYVRRLGHTVGYAKSTIDNIKRLHAQKFIPPATKSAVRNAAEVLTAFARELA